MASLAHGLAAGIGGDIETDSPGLAAGIDLWGEEILWSAETGDMELAPNGDYQLVTGVAAIRQAIRIRLMTRKGSLPWAPTFGVGIEDYLGNVSTDSARSRLRGEIIDQLLQDPRLDSIEDAGVEEQTINGQRVLVVQVRCSAAGTAVPATSFQFGGG